MTRSDLADQFNLYARSNDNAYDEAIGDAEPGTELHRMRVVYFKWRTERAHAYRHAAEMVRGTLVPRWTKDLPTASGTYWYRSNGGPRRLMDVSEDPSAPGRFGASELLTTSDNPEGSIELTRLSDFDPNVTHEWCAIPEPVDSPSP